MPPGVPAPKPTNAALPLVPLLLLSWFFPSEAAAPAAAAAAAAAAEVPSTERGAIDVGVASRAPPWLLAPPPGASGLLPASTPFSLPLSSLLLLDGEAPSSPPLPPLRGVTQSPIPPPTCDTRSLATAAPSGRAGEGGGSSSPGTAERFLRWKNEGMIEMKIRRACVCRELCFGSYRDIGGINCYR